MVSGFRNIFIFDRNRWLPALLLLNQIPLTTKESNFGLNMTKDHIL
jgi:hypothetical protein